MKIEDFPDTSILFWTCPNGCQDFVDWNHKVMPPVATCRKCKANNEVEKCKWAVPIKDCQFRNAVGLCTTLEDCPHDINKENA